MQQNSLRNILQTIYQHLLNIKAAQTQLYFLIHLNLTGMQYRDQKCILIQWGGISLLLVTISIL